VPLARASRRLCVSFSGGETSAYMTWWILRNWRSRYDQIVVVFANTGEEWEATLEFVRNCDEQLGFGTVWVEAVQHHGERVAPTHRVVSFETASRNGAPFEDAIRKYGIPNTKFKDCTRNLKTRPIESYLRSIGWTLGTYDLAIGIRADEIDRLSVNAAERRIVYPLVTDQHVTKKMINKWWRQQAFRLELKGYQGNCKWCWKKSFRKHFTIISETPEAYDFPRRMEAKYGKVGPEFRHDPATRRAPISSDYRRTFFRGNMSTTGLFAAYEQRRERFVPAGDDNRRYDTFLDVGGGCEESCEVFSDEDEEAAL
jgi:hypothetical protein